jgi:hypothetical protein
MSWSYFYPDVWKPGSEAAGLEHRSPYNLRHTYALHSLQAGVPIATLAGQMGHADVNRTFATCGGWVPELGADAALRERGVMAPKGRQNGPETECQSRRRVPPTGRSARMTPATDPVNHAVYGPTVRCRGWERLQAFFAGRRQYGAKRRSFSWVVR